MHKKAFKKTEIVTNSFGMNLLINYQQDSI